MTFGEKVRQLRIKQNLTQDTLACMTGISKARISNYERNKRRPKWEVAHAIANALGTPLSELYGENQDENNGEGAPSTCRAKKPYNWRLKKMTAAFDKLSDKGQMELIKRAEELSCVPAYKSHN